MSKPKSAFAGLVWPAANLATTTLIGGLAAGQIGALVGFGAGLIVTLLPSLSRAGLAAGRGLIGPISRAKGPIRAAAVWLGGGLIAVGEAAQLVSHGVSRLAPPVSPVGRMLKRLLRNLRAFLAHLLSEDELPRTLTNVLMALVLGCGLFGIKFAFYLAVIATPTLVFVLLQSAVQAGEGPASTSE
jgi:hypothetical protein